MQHPRSNAGCAAAFYLLVSIGCGLGFFGVLGDQAQHPAEKSEEPDKRNGAAGLPPPFFRFT